MNINDITEQLHLSRPAISHHLKIMLQAQAVSVEQIGKERFYSIAMHEPTEKLRQLSEFMATRYSIQINQSSIIDDII